MPGARGWLHRADPCARKPYRAGPLSLISRIADASRRRPRSKRASSALHLLGPRPIVMAGSGAIAQLGERLDRTQEVASSSLASSINESPAKGSVLVTVQLVGGHSSASSNLGVWIGLRRKRSMTRGVRL